MLDCQAGRLAREQLGRAMYRHGEPAARTHMHGSMCIVLDLHLGWMVVSLPGRPIPLKRGRSGRESSGQKALLCFGTRCGSTRFALEFIPAFFQLAAKLAHPARRNVEALCDGTGPLPHGELLGYFPIPGRQ
jgi:hypothetical protein